MKHTISAATVTETWQWVAQTGPSDAPQLVEQMQEEQPVALAHLLALDHLPFHQHERETIFYIGLVVWQIMKRSPIRLNKVTRQKLNQAADANFDLLEMLSSDTAADFHSATLTLLENCPEPEVFRYIVEALMDEEEYEPGDEPIRDELRGMAFVHLNILLDAFIASLARHRN